MSVLNTSRVENENIKLTFSLLRTLVSGSTGREEKKGRWKWRGSGGKGEAGWEWTGREERGVRVERVRR